MNRVKVVLAVACAASLFVPTPAHAPHRRARYLSPRSSDGMVFPVARTNWYSVINFADDWHAPRMRFIDGKWRLVGYHEGNDIFAEPGTPIRAVTGGTVDAIGWTFYSGWRVGIRDGAGRYWLYAHVSSFAPDLFVGKQVAAGDLIARVGNTGYGEDPGHRDEFTHHLHIGIQEPTGVWVNPYPLMRSLYKAAVAENR